MAELDDWRGVDGESFVPDKDSIKLCRRRSGLAGALLFRIAGYLDWGARCRLGGVRRPGSQTLLRDRFGRGCVLSTGRPPSISRMSGAWCSSSIRAAWVCSCELLVAAADIGDRSRHSCSRIPSGVLYAGTRATACPRPWRRVISLGTSAGPQFPQHPVFSCVDGTWFRFCDMFHFCRNRRAREAHDVIPGYYRTASP